MIQLCNPTIYHRRCSSMLGIPIIFSTICDVISMGRYFLIWPGQVEKACLVRTKGLKVNGYSNPAKDLQTSQSLRFNRGGNLSRRLLNQISRKSNTLPFFFQPNIMALTTRRIARESTPDRSIVVGEAITRQQIEFYRDFDSNYPSKSMPSICARYASYFA